MYIGKTLKNLEVVCEWIYFIYDICLYNQSFEIPYTWESTTY